jgi:hypothetical protein
VACQGFASPRVPANIDPCPRSSRHIALALQIRSSHHKKWVHQIGLSRPPLVGQNHNSAIACCERPQCVSSPCGSAPACRPVQRGLVGAVEGSREGGNCSSAHLAYSATSATPHGSPPSSWPPRRLMPSGYRPRQRHCPTSSHRDKRSPRSLAAETRKYATNLPRCDVIAVPSTFL